MKAKGLGTGLACSVFVTSCFLGWSLGRSYSPDYESETAAKIFLASHLQVDELSGDDACLSLATNIERFQYRLSTDKVDPKPLSREKLASMPLPRRNVFKEQERVAALVGITAAPTGLAGLVSKTRRVAGAVSGPQRAVIYALGGAWFVTGGGLGFWLGYKDKPDYDSAVLLKVLKDPNSWRSHAEELRDCYRSRREYRQLQIRNMRTVPLGLGDAATSKALSGGREKVLMVPLGAGDATTSKELSEVQEKVKPCLEMLERAGQADLPLWLLH